MTWNEFFELIDDSLFTLDLAYRDDENDDAVWVDEHFRDSLAVIQEKDETNRKCHLKILKARVHAVRRLLNGDIIPHAFASSGIPLKAAIFLEDKVPELLGMADDYLKSQKTIDDKLHFFYQFDLMLQSIPSERIKVPNMDVLDSLRQEWIMGKPMTVKDVSLAETYYGNTVSWLMNTLVSRFNGNEENMYKECFEEMSLISANGLPTKWATQIYLCGINSRKVSTELSLLIDEPEDDIITLSMVSNYLRDNALKLSKNSNCSDLAKAWLEVFLIKQASCTKEIKKVKNFYFGKDIKEDIPDFLVCKKRGDGSYLCSVDLKFTMKVKDTEGLPFSNVADIPGVYFRRDGSAWKMKNVNPYISII